MGLYTSPHLVSATERILVDGVPITEDAFAQWTETLRPHIERVEASFFECLTAIAFADFAARGVDVAVIEVGLGGRLDATNVITPMVSVVTKIALEHTDYLGPDLVSIAKEKAGIAKKGVPFITGEQDHRVLQVLREEASLRGATPIVPVPHSAFRIPPLLGLRGPHQAQNAAVARAALRVLPAPFGLPGTEIPASFSQAWIPGRFEVRGNWIFDVAHNPDGMEVLIAALDEARPRRPLHALVGIRNDKEWRPMLKRILPAVDQLVLTVAPTVPENQRWLARDLAGWADTRVIGQPVVFEPDFARALALVQEGAATTLVTGSFHTVGDALAALPGFAPVG